MSDKNTLQEYCQRNGFPMPVYNSISSGKAHQLNWSASVTIQLNEESVTMSSLTMSTSKTLAEKQAAAVMLDFIKMTRNISSKSLKLTQPTQVQPTQAQKSSSIKKNASMLSETLDIRNITEFNCGIDELKNIEHIYLIDLENKPSFQLIANSQSIYIGFINSIHHAVSKYNQWLKSETDSIETKIKSNNKLLYLIEGGTKDLVDHMLTAFSYVIAEFILEHSIIPTIHLISSDHAIWCTKICMEKIFEWKKIVGIKIQTSNNI